MNERIARDRTYRSGEHSNDEIGQYVPNEIIGDRSIHLALHFSFNGWSVAYTNRPKEIKPNNTSIDTTILILP